jgi:multidrug efflux pump subunit AcrA (membrane-fusion protein)
MQLQRYSISTTASGVVEKRIYGRKWKLCQVNITVRIQRIPSHVKILVRQGQRVNQGDVIGRVGSTGLATGPHVCYRFGKTVSGRRLD